MKILMTGATKAQCDAYTERGRRAILQKIDVPAYVKRTLEGEGHVVDQRVVTPGEHLGGYDLMWINVAGILSMHGTYGLGMLWAMSESLLGNIPAVMFFDDWKVKNTLHHLGWSSSSELDVEDNKTNLDHQLGKCVSGKFVLYPATQFQPVVDSPIIRYRLMEAGQKFCSFRWSGTRWMCVCPQYAWGSMTPKLHALIRHLNLERYRAIDPTSQVPLVECSTFLPRSRRHALASLSDQRDWVQGLDLGWPVDYYGYRGKGNFHPVRLKTETDVQMTYRARWGILSPPYEHSGAGWWRSRILYAANGGSVLLSAPSETLGLGGQYYHDVHAVEGADDAQLARIARLQGEIFWAKVWSGVDWTVRLRHLIEDTTLLNPNLD